MKLLARRMTLLIFGVFGCFSLLGCGPVKMPVQSRFLLGNLTLPKARPSRTALTLLVSDPVASPGYRSSEMIYMNSPYELKSYANNRWVSPPAQMLGLLLARAFQEHAYFRAVVVPPFLGVTDYRLETRLLRLQQEFIESVSRVRLAVQISLVDNTDQAIVANHRFELVLPAPTNNPIGGVAAANQAALQISREVAAFCIHSLSSRSQSHTSTHANPH